jgi:hypothetical protein
MMMTTTMTKMMMQWHQLVHQPMETEEMADSRK